MLCTAVCQFGLSLGVQMDRRAFTLQPLIAQGILHPGENRLSCAVGGIDYFAGEMPEKPRPMHRFLLGTTRSNSQTSMPLGSAQVSYISSAAIVSPSNDVCATLQNIQSRQKYKISVKLSTTATESMHVFITTSQDLVLLHFGTSAQPLYVNMLQIWVRVERSFSRDSSSRVPRRSLFTSSANKIPAGRPTMAGMPNICSTWNISF